MVIERHIDVVTVKDTRGYAFDVQEEQYLTNMIPHSKNVEISNDALEEDAEYYET